MNEKCHLQTKRNLLNFVGLLPKLGMHGKGSWIRLIPCMENPIGITFCFYGKSLEINSLQLEG